ncbi:MAG TPA: hypothetical protein VHS32_28215, partial [Streptosporangiaceae bacterium]|nr:hypothetical protein [Streptosporangiaceae bacterium]
PRESRRSVQPLTRTLHESIGVSAAAETKVPLGLKRYIARQLCRTLTADMAVAPDPNHWQAGTERPVRLGAGFERGWSRVDDRGQPRRAQSRRRHEQTPSTTENRMTVPLLPTTATVSLDGEGEVFEMEPGSLVRFKTSHAVILSSGALGGSR